MRIIGADSGGDMVTLRNCKTTPPDAALVQALAVPSCLTMIQHA